MNFFYRRGPDNIGVGVGNLALERPTGLPRQGVMDRFHLVRATIGACAPATPYDGSRVVETRLGPTVPGALYLGPLVRDK